MVDRGFSLKLHLEDSVCPIAHPPQTGLDRMAPSMHLVVTGDMNMFGGC